MAKHKQDAWFAWTMVTVGALCLTNALWFYSWRERAVSHAEELNAARSRPAAQERVIYEYRPASPAPEPYVPTEKRTLSADEECRSGVVIRRSGNAIESTGERC